MNRQTHFDVGGGRDPPVPDYGYRGYPGLRPGSSPFSQNIPQPQAPQVPYQPQQAQPQQAQPQQAQPQGQPGSGLSPGYDGRGAFGYNPYGQYTYNPYGYRPGYYGGWNRPVQPSNPWSGILGFPFNLFGLGGGGGGSSSAYRPWWSGNRWGLFF